MKRRVGLWTRHLAREHSMLQYVTEKNPLHLNTMGRDMAGFVGTPSNIFVLRAHSESTLPIDGD